MPDYRNAFLPGEWAMVADEDQMRRELGKYRNREEVIAALRPHIGERIRIIGYGFPHGSGVLYELKGIAQQVWEECLIDWAITPGDSSYGAAIEFYQVGIESRDGEEYVMIRDKSGRLFSQTWHDQPDLAIKEISQVATIRTRLSFEYRYGFTGDLAEMRPAATKPK